MAEDEVEQTYEEYEKQVRHMILEDYVVPEEEVDRFIKEPASVDEIQKGMDRGSYPYYVADRIMLKHDQYSYKEDMGGGSEFREDEPRA